MYADSYKENKNCLRVALTHFKRCFIVEAEKMFDVAMKNMMSKEDYLTPAVILWKIFKSLIESIDRLVKNKLYKPAYEIADDEDLQFCAEQIKSYLSKK